MSFKQNLGDGVSLNCDAIHTQVKFLQGKVLTVIDASYADKVQRKAVKDLINGAFSDQLMYVSQLCYPKIQMLTNDQARSTLKDYESVVNEHVE